jgi:hypothetical protein
MSSFLLRCKLARRFRRADSANRRGALQILLYRLNCVIFFHIPTAGTNYLLVAICTIVKKSLRGSYPYEPELKGLNYG